MTTLQLLSIGGIRDQGSGIGGFEDPCSVRIRSADADDAAAIHALIVAHLAEGHLLPRERGEIAVHAHRFVIAVQGGETLACAALAPLGRSVAEVRSLVVSREARHVGIGRRLIDELLRRATAAGFDTLCAFTHAPGYFTHLGFSIVPPAWLPEKIGTDCHSCRLFRRCEQYAVIRSLERPRHACVPLAALHG